MTELSKEELQGYEQQAEVIAKRIGISKVHVYVGIDDNNDRVVGFIKEPSRMQKLFAMDKIATVGPFMAGEELRDALTLKDDSDPRTYSDSADCDKYVLGMTGTCVTIIEVAQNSFKKK